MDTSDPIPSDPVLSLPPVKRAAYSDRMSVLMAEMSRLAYIPFEQPQDKDLDQAIGEIRASKSDEHARNILNEFYRNYRAAGQIEARQELSNGLGRLGFKLVSTYAVGETQAFLAIREHVDGRGSGAPGILVLSFRGTEKKVQDWKTDLKARKTIMRMSGIPVHQGFWEAFNLVRPKISSDVAPLTDAGYTLYLTGHSLGGALALIATREIGSDSTGACYTFGQPRVSGYGFAQEIKTPIYRVVNASDMVPRVPPAVLPRVLLFALRLVRFPGRAWLTDILEMFAGYVHHGDMRYLTKSKGDADRRYEDVRLLANPNMFDRATWWVGDLFWTLLGPAADHAISKYCEKLRAYAMKRNR